MPIYFDTKPVGQLKTKINLGFKHYNKPKH